MQLLAKFNNTMYMGLSTLGSRGQLKLIAFLAGHTVAMATDSVIKSITTC